MWALIILSLNMDKAIAGATKWGLFKLRYQLLAIGLVLLSLPYLGYRFIDATGGLLQQSQSQAQKLVAQSLANVFVQRPELLLQLPELSKQQPLLFVQSINQSKNIDGLADDWRNEMVQASEFSSPQDRVHFTVTLGKFEQQLLGKVQVYDQHWVSPDSSANNRLHSDHLRLSYVDSQQQAHHLLFLSPEQGTVQIHQTNAQGNAIGQQRNHFAIQASMQINTDGYLLEWQMPLALMGEKQLLSLAVVDADDAHNTPNILSTQGPEQGGYTALNTLSNQAMALLAGQQKGPLSVTLYDQQLNRLGHTGHLPNASPDTWNWQLGELWQQVTASLLNQVLSSTNPVQGEASHSRPRLLNLALAGITVQDRWALPHSQGIQATAMPITNSQQQVLGVVLVEQGIDQLLQLQRQAMEKVVLVSLTSISLIMLSLFLLFWRLAQRIRTLGKYTHSLVDAYGRMQDSSLTYGTQSNDELGDLARDIAQVMTRLQSHQRFLSNIPRTLSHEIKNPLNTISTSLGNLSTELADHPSREYLDAAQRGLYKIEGILNKLASAASLEQALQQEPTEPVDLAHLLHSYCSFQSQVDALIDYQGPQQGIMVTAVDYRLEQALDKLLDNARDFRTPDTPILVSIVQDGAWAKVSVCNQGPAITPQQAEHLFHSMASQRSNAKQGGDGHFGLGLFVVRIICEHLGGQVSWHNLSNSQGVCFSMRLPAHI